MVNRLAIAMILGTLGLAGCATADGDAWKPDAAKAAGRSDGVRTLTGSRIPDKPPRDRMIRRIEGQDWAREDRTSTISHQDRPGN